MKIAVVCRSDSNGGAAVVSRRLTEALREQGHDARMLVLSTAPGRPLPPYIIKACYPLLRPLAFLAERLQIFLANGFSRKNLFKVDTAAFGLPLWRHPVIKEADAVILNWVNQGMLSLHGVERIARSGKKVVWTMHDMWNLTGICHHAMECRRFTARCGACPLLGNARSQKTADLSSVTWERKRRLYSGCPVRFVAVSSWLAAEAARSSLLGGSEVAVIPNAFRPVELQAPGRSGNATKKILFAAAGLDNWIKGLDTFREAIAVFEERYPELASSAEVTLMGSLRNPGAAEGFRLPCRHIGSVAGEEALAEVYAGCDVVVNASSFENLPGTLIEGQAYGAVPVAFDRGGQRDIIDHLSTGYLAEWDDAPAVRAARLADGIAWALSIPADIRGRMRASVDARFSYASVAASYLNLLTEKSLTS